MEQGIILFATRFAKEGYYVFPFYGSSKGPLKPFGWARNKVGDDVDPKKVIPATIDLNVIRHWPEIVKEAYNAKVVGYGVMGIDRVIFDLDNKDGKSGSASYKKFAADNNMPPPTFVVKSKSGGYHLYFAKPDKLKSIGIKSVAGLKVGAQKYEGLDVRGDGGMVVGPLAEGPESEWTQGVYQIIKGNPESELAEIPTNVIMALSRSSMQMENVYVQPKPEESSELDYLKRGEIPPTLSNGNRNNGFFIYLSALKNKGFNADTARAYAKQLVAVTEDPSTLADSVDLEDMISRIWRVNLDNVYDVARDIIDSGLYRLTSYRNKLMYVNLEENQYLDTKSAHDLPSMKQLMQKFTRKMVNQDGKSKIVNPAELIDGMIPPDKEVSTLGFKPGASEVFTLTDAHGGRRYLNTWRDPRTLIDSGVDDEFWEKFKFIVERIFGPAGTDEYQLGLDFPAWLLQNPGIKPVIAPFIMSRVRGAGKSLYISLLAQIFGYNKQGELQARQYKVEEIGTRFFNPGGSSILMFDEVQFPVHRDMRKESVTFWKHLKSLVTLDTIPVEFKGGDVGVQMPNFAGIIMAGNTGNHFPIEEFDRRIWLIDNDPPELEEGVVDEFFAMQKNLLTVSEKRRIINTLLTRLSQHQIKLPLDRMRAPMSDIKQEMYVNSLSDIEEWWITYFSDHDNLLSTTPLLSKSAVLYLIGVAERLANTKWREDPEGTFRELKRRGLVQPVRTKGNNYQTRNLKGVVIIKPDGGVIQEGEGRDVLYTTRQHGEFNAESNEAILQMYLRNINGITKWRQQRVAQMSARVAAQN